MALICPKCGAENRDAAKFCLKCAHQLVALAPAPAPADPPRKRRRKRRPAADATVAPRGRHRAALIALLAVFAIGALWGIGRIAARTPAPLAEAPATTTP
ncbi:MAG TPA: zinc ribbon domain-containing protein, partial [Ottowia beijingensis]|nr:zinc ribbon domain-containing protein [Ottowia beijingensis]